MNDYLWQGFEEELEKIASNFTHSMKAVAAHGVKEYGVDKARKDLDSYADQISADSNEIKPKYGVGGLLGGLAGAGIGAFKGRKTGALKGAAKGSAIGALGIIGLQGLMQHFDRYEQSDALQWRALPNKTKNELLKEWSK